MKDRHVWMMLVLACIGAIVTTTTPEGGAAPSWATLGRHYGTWAATLVGALWILTD
jgi:hypothetical protein